MLPAREGLPESNVASYPLPCRLAQFAPSACASSFQRHSDGSQRMNERRSTASAHRR